VQPLCIPPSLRGWTFEDQTICRHCAWPVGAVSVLLAVIAAATLDIATIQVLIGLTAIGGSLLCGMVFLKVRKAAAGVRRAAVTAGERQQLLDVVDLAAIMVRDLNGTIRFWSEGCSRLYGWTAEQAIGQPAHALLRTAFQVPLQDIEAALLRDGAWSGELQQHTRDGAAITVAVHKALSRGPDGIANAVMENVTETTALHQAESTVPENEARLRLVQQVGGVAYSDRLLAKPTALISDVCVRLYGLPPGKTELSPAEWHALVHPADRDRFRRAGMRGLVRHGGSVTSDFRICRPDGSVRWVTMRAEAFLGQDKRPVRIVSAQHDITEIVAAREVLLARQEELEQRVALRTNALAAAEARFHGIFDSQFHFVAMVGERAALVAADDFTLIRKPVSARVLAAHIEAGLEATKPPH
jgi:PAS domain S-box-containing protein